MKIELFLIRSLDVSAALLVGLAAVPLVAVIGIIIRVTSSGPAIFRQTRLGLDEQPFICLKLRTMAEGTQSAATHEVPATAITPIGRVLRRTKIDEVPQLWNVLIGDMSLVGPRPGLPHQTDLAHERRMRGVFSVRPGITGPGQVNEIDMSTPIKLAKIDAAYAANPTISGYFRYLILTIIGRGQGDRVRY
jgi:O-antigen biosynthesis protein WbqP